MELRRPADYKSAIQQNAILRYFSIQSAEVMILG